MGLSVEEHKVELLQHLASNIYVSENKFRYVVLMTILIFRYLAE